MTTFVLCRLIHGTRGTAPLQGVIILAVGLFILLGLRSLAGRSITVAGDGGAAAAPEPAPGPPAAVAARPALAPEAEAAQRRLDELPELELMRDVASLAYNRVGTGRFDGLMAKYGPAWNITFYDVPQTGAKLVMLTAKDPNDRRVLVGVGGTEGADPRHWGVNLGQHLGAMSAGEAVGDVAAGLVGRSLPAIALAPARYALSTLGRTDYEGFRQIGATLKRAYGAGNVRVAGHSKGAGEATFMGAMNGLRTYTFNSAGMSGASLDIIRRSGVANPEQYVTNVVAEGEILSRVDPGDKVGEVITVEGKEGGRGSSLDNHGLDNILIDRPVRYEPAKPLPR